MRPAGRWPAKPRRNRTAATCFATGLAINLGNPKVIVFFLALLPTVVDLGALTALGFAELALILAAIAASVLTAYALAAARAPAPVQLAGRWPPRQPGQRDRHGWNGRHNRCAMKPPRRCCQGATGVETNRCRVIPRTHHISLKNID